MQSISLEITAHTLLIAKPIALDLLSDAEKLQCVPGQKLQIDAYTECNGEYLKVCPLREVYGFAAWYVPLRDCRVRGAIG